MTFDGLHATQDAADFPKEDPALRDVFGTLGQRYQIGITSTDTGVHAFDSAHYHRKAIDVGVLDGQPVGFNRSTWNFICDLIASGKVNKIGTFAALANNEALQRYAQANLVELFDDEGSGNHVHVQVP